MKSECDVTVVGGGPAGLTAGLYLARGGLSAIIFEHMAPGGQAVMTDVVENYPGFTEPVNGFELARAMHERDPSRDGEENHRAQHPGYGPGDVDERNCLPRRHDGRRGLKRRAASEEDFGSGQSPKTPWPARPGL